jgi:hypothetical protein
VIAPTNTRVVNMPVNIAGYERLTFKGIMEDFAEALGVTQPLTYWEAETTELPSVKQVTFRECAAGTDVLVIRACMVQGPVDLSRAEELLGWESTPWAEVVKEGVPWYEEAMTDPRYESERKQVLRLVYEYAVQHGKEWHLPAALEKAYGLKVRAVT